MDFSGILSWLFSSREGVLVLLGVILVGFLIAASAIVMSDRVPEKAFTVLGVPAFAFVCYVLAFVLAFAVLHNIWARHRRRHSK